METKQHIRWSTHRSDIAGIIASGLCAIHCALLPIFAAFLPMAEQFFENERIHQGFLILAMLFVGVSAKKHLGMHKNKSIIALFIGGLALLSIGLLGHEMEQEFIHLGASFAGGVLLLWAHAKNIKHCLCLHEHETCASTKEAA